MKVFLTGGNGMVGQNILEHPQAKNHEIFSPSSSELDLLGRDAVQHYIEAVKPDLIIHAAGIVGGIQANIAQPVNFLVGNIQIGEVP